MKISTSNASADIVSLGVGVSGQGNKTEETTSFQSFMKQSAPKQNVDTRTGDSVKQAAKTADKKEEPKQVEKSKPAVDKTEKTDTVKTDKHTDTDTAKQPDDVNVQAEDVRTQAESEQPETVLPVTEGQPEFSEDVLAIIQTAIADVVAFTQNLQDIIGMSEQEFDSMLEQLDMQTTDLLDVNMLKDFVLAAKDAQPVDMLTDESLVQLMNDTEAVMPEIPEELLPQITEGVEKAFTPVVTEDAGQETVTVREEEPEQTTVKAETNTVQVTVETDRPKAESETAGDDTEHDDRQPMPKEFGQQVIQNLEQAVENVRETADVRETTQADIIRQVVEQIKIIAKEDTTSMEMQLYPQHLGKIAIQVSSKNGMVTAQITAETEMARAALENSIQTLKESFLNQDLKVEAIEVMVATSSFSGGQFENPEADESNSQNKSGNRRINLSDLDEAADELSEEEELNVEMMKAEGRSVDYTA